MDLETIMEQAGKSCSGLKDPELTSQLEDLEKFLPESKFIDIIREGRAVVNSYMENRCGLGTNAYPGGLRWMREVELQLTFHERHPRNVHLLMYEELVQNTEHELRHLMDFLVMPFDDEMLRYSEKPAHYHQTRGNVHTYRQPDIRLTAR